MTNTDMSLRDAAQAVIDRWETPLWKDAPATAVFIADLRDALARDAGRAAHVQNPAEIEHVAGDVSKNGAEVNMNAQQPAPVTQPAQQQEAQEPVAVVVPCYTPSGKRVALYSAKQDLPIGTKLYTAPQSSPAAQAASSTVLKAIRKANMQLVRTGDDAFMLVPYKVATAQAAESVPAPVLDSLALMKVVMQADEALSGRCTRGTTNWAAAIGKAVQDAVLAARARLLDSDLSNLTERGAAAWAGVDAQKLREDGTT